MQNNSLNQSSRTILFDLDGTLVDTAKDIVTALNTVLREENVAPIEIEKAPQLVGFGGRVMLARAFEMVDVEKSSQELEACFERWLEIYLNNLCIFSKPYPGVEALLEKCRMHGYRLGVCTNKHEQPARDLLRKLGLDNLFHAICGGDTFAEKKPSSVHVLGTLEAARGTADNAFMVGDSITDLRAAQAASVPSILVDFGYSDTSVTMLGADHVISHFNELWSIIKS